MTATEPPTSRQLLELAARAKSLAADILALRPTPRTDDDEMVRQVGFRINDAASMARRVARMLERLGGEDT